MRHLFAIAAAALRRLVGSVRAMIRYLFALALTLAIAGCDVGQCDPWHPENRCDGHPVSTVDTSGGAVPCGPAVCDDGAGGMLQDVGERCSGDDMTPAPSGGPSCCHGLVCQGVISTDMGACARVTSTAGEVCPVVWLYQCDGWYQSGGLSQTSTQQFPGPPPSAINVPGGWPSWAKITFFARFPVLVDQHGNRYALISAKNCKSLGPYSGQP